MTTTRLDFRGQWSILLVAMLLLTLVATGLRTQTERFLLCVTRPQA